MNNELSPMEQELASGKPTMLITHGSSMEPLLYDTSTTVVAVRCEGDLLPGDLPLYKRPNGQYVLHRIIRVEDDAYYIRGDNQTGLERVPKTWVLGVVTAISRKGKEYSVTDTSYRFYVHFWNAIYPLRWFIYKCRALIRRKYHR